MDDDAQELDDWTPLSIEREEEEEDDSPPPKEKEEVVPEIGTIDYGQLNTGCVGAIREARKDASAVASMDDGCFDPLNKDTAASWSDHVHLHQLRADVLAPALCRGALCVLRGRGIVDGRPERYAYVARDFNPTTRLEWDKQFTEVAQQQSFNVAIPGKVHYVEARYAMPPTPLGSTIHDRWVSGVLSFDHDRRVDMYRVVFQSLRHPEFRPPRGCGEVGVTCALFACPAGAEREKKTELTVVMMIHSAPTGSWLGRMTGVEQRLKYGLQTWMYTLERTVVEWERYYGKRAKQVV